MTDEELVEQVARKLAVQLHGDDNRWRDYLDDARAIIPLVEQATAARIAMLIETAAFQTAPDNPPHEIWTHGFETAREVFAASIRALQGGTHEAG